MAGTAEREQDAAEESNYSTILHALCRLSVDFGVLVITLREIHSMGRERSGMVGYCAGRDGNGFQMDCNSWEWDRNGFISTGWDGARYDCHSRVPL